MSFVVIAVAVLSLLAVGAAVTLPLRRLLSLRTPCDALPIVFAASSIVAANWALAQVAARQVIHPAWLVVPSVALLMWNARGWHLKSLALPPLDRGHGLVAVIGVFVLLRLTVGLVVSMNRDMGWDGVFYWGLRAKMLLTPELEYFTDPLLQHTNPHYPWVLPALDAWTYHWAGFTDLRAVKWISSFSLAMSGLLVYLGLRRVRGPASAALFAVAVLLPRPAGEMILQSYADLTLGTFFAGAVIYGYFYVQTLKDEHLWPMALFLTAGALTKKEGELLALALILALALSLVARWRVWAPAAVRIGGLVAALGFAPWLAFQLAIHPLAYGYVGLSRDTIVSAVHRVPDIVTRFKGELVSLEGWGPTWVSLPLALLAFPSRLLRREVVFLLIATVLPLVFYADAYAFTIWPSVVDHMNSSLTRLFLHLGPAVLFSAGVISCPSLPNYSRSSEGAPLRPRPIL